MDICIIAIPALAAGIRILWGLGFEYFTPTAHLNTSDETGAVWNPQFLPERALYHQPSPGNTLYGSTSDGQQFRAMSDEYRATSPATSHEEVLA